MPLATCCRIARSAAQAKQPGVCASFGGEFYPDGKPDTYKDPKREYEAVEFEVRKSFSHNWALSVNYRSRSVCAAIMKRLPQRQRQADPGISSLFDLTEGQLGLLVNQQSIGFLSTDRKHVLNAHSTYVVPGGKLKGFVVGGGVSVLSGNPLTTLVAQQAYVQPGEVPVFGRGDLGRSPVNGSVGCAPRISVQLSSGCRLRSRLTSSTSSIPRGKPPSSNSMTSSSESRIRTLQSP